MNLHPMLAVIPARRDSRGMPGKNIRTFIDRPLIAHSIAFAALCPEIDRCIVSTDGEAIREAALVHGGVVPFLRPAELAADHTPMLPVLQHALLEMERLDKRRYETILLLQPTSPARLPQDCSAVLTQLQSDSNCVGVVTVAEASFNPYYTGVVAEKGYLAPAFLVERTTRRQDAPPFLRVNGLLYLWRRDYIAQTSQIDFAQVPHRYVVTPRERSFDIDDVFDFQLAELAVQHGLCHLPWVRKVQTVTPRPG